jgi:para-nitrobenzyl esterase
MDEAPIAEPSLGSLRGLWRGGIALFRGVPYAAPPLGALRFAAPEPGAAWRGVRDATRHGPIPPQGRSRLAAVMGEGEAPAQDEDCLTLTIATPAPDAGKRPVMLFLHGGAWMTGAGSLAWHDSTLLAREGGIVAVAANYRLGALGYLAAPGIAGNFGTSDQIAALRWVRDHIAAFGGDPQRITLVGQSAGATSIGRLLLEDEARPLFAQAVLQSGGFGRQPMTRAEAGKEGARFCALVEIDVEAGDAVAALRRLPVPRLLEAQARLARENARFGETMPAFVPTVPHTLSASALLAAMARAGVGKRFLIGATREECHAFFALDPAMRNPPPDAVAAHFARFGGDADAIERYRARRPAASIMDLLADVASDHTFIWDAMRLAEACAALGAETYAYRFAWSPPGSVFKACHTIELPFLFGNFDAWRDAPMLAGGDPAEMAALSASVRSAWIRFIHGAAPLPVWPAYDKNGRATMVFDRVVEIAGDAHGIDWRGRVVG